MLMINACSNTPYGKEILFSHSIPPNVKPDNICNCSKAEEKQIIKTPKEIESIVYFETDNYALNTQAIAALEEVIAEIGSHKLYQLFIEGHTDVRASKNYNLSLSQKRAESVLFYLTGRGIIPEQKTTRWLGESSPIASNDTNEGMAQNRRTVIRAVIY